MSEQTSQNPIPSTQPRKLAQTYEPLPQYYRQEGSDIASHEAQLINTLAQELNWSDLDQPEGLARHSYSIARELGDSEILERSQDAFAVVDETRSSSRFNTTFLGDTEDAGHVSQRLHGEYTPSREFALNIRYALERGTALKQQLTERGVTLEPGHVTLLQLLQTAGHEAGHLIQAGIASQRISTDLSIMSRNSLVTQPDQATTGHLETDAHIRDEQFAEGYGNMVLTRAASSLGYNEEVIAALIDVFAIPAAQLQTLEHLSHVTPEQGLKEVAAAAGIANPNVGEAGYIQPLTAEQVIGDLELMSEVMKGQASFDITQAGYRPIVRRPAATTRLEHSLADAVRRKRNAKRAGKFLKRMIRQ